VTKPVTAERSSSSTPPTTETKKKRRGYRGLIILLVLLCLTFAALSGWLWYQNQSPKKVLPVASRTHTVREQQLQDSLSAGSNMLVLYDSIFGKSISVGDTLFINRDSMLVDGSGMVLRADSCYHGPALFITPTVKKIALHNLVFENFDLAVLCASKFFQFQNVRFVNCRVPVQYQFLFQNNQYITGKINDSVFLQTDSLVQ